MVGVNYCRSISKQESEIYELIKFNTQTQAQEQGLVHCGETWEEFSSGLTMFLCPHLAANTAL